MLLVFILWRQISSLKSQSTAYTTWPNTIMLLVAYVLLRYRTLGSWFIWIGTKYKKYMYSNFHIPIVSCTFFFSGGGTDGASFSTLSVFSCCPGNVRGRILRVSVFNKLLSTSSSSNFFRLISLRDRLSTLCARDLAKDNAGDDGSAEWPWPVIDGDAVGSFVKDVISESGIKIFMLHYNTYTCS